MTDSGTTLEAGQKIVTTAGTRVQLPGVQSFAAKTVVIQALGTNEGVIVVGDKTVVAAAGSHAAPTQIGIELAAKAILSIDVIDGSAIWLDATKSGDAVSFVYLRA